MAAGEHLQLLPVLRLEVLMMKTLEPFLPGQVAIAEQALAARHQAVLTLLLAEGIEELGRAPAFCLSLLVERLPGCESGKVSAL